MPFSNIKERTTLTIEAETERRKKTRAVRLCLFFGLASRDCALHYLIIRCSLVFAKVLDKDQAEWCLPGMLEADMELSRQKGHDWRHAWIHANTSRALTTSLFSLMR
jgi:hypothetical protein